MREASYPRRVYFAPFKDLALNFGVRRAAVLLGPRRVGKTVMLKQLAHDAIQGGCDPRCIMYASIDAPIYSGISLERFLTLFPSDDGDQRIVMFDEIQYLKDWETHLKDLVDSYPNTKFIASGSAAAALRLKSKESGAGRFSEFMLPPLTFAEFLQFRQDEDKLVEPLEGTIGSYRAKDIDALNVAFVDYLNYGGYPEAVLNKEIRDNPDQFIRNDIIDKVLLKDLPSLYGIHEIQDLNRLFSFLAYNAGNEASLENICQGSGITKPTIKRYIEYLESAFLIIKLATVDENCRSLQRERVFKVYLNNPSMRAALFAPVQANEAEKIGHLAESAVFSQWQHSNGFRHLRYARWRNEGEVDVVFLSREGRPSWMGEIKWSDRIRDTGSRELKSLLVLRQNHRKTITQAFFTTRTFSDELGFAVDGLPVQVTPTALYCYTVGKNATKTRSRLPAPGMTLPTPALDDDEEDIDWDDIDVLEDDDDEDKENGEP